MKRTALTILIAGLAPVMALYGWGREGHRIVADIAQERLSEMTKRNVQSLIGNNTLASRYCFDPSEILICRKCTFPARRDTRI